MQQIQINTLVIDSRDSKYIEGNQPSQLSKAMNNTELTLDQLSNVSGAALNHDFCIDPLILKLIISGQKIPTILKGKSIHSR